MIGYISNILFPRLSFFSLLPTLFSSLSPTLFFSLPAISGELKKKVRFRFSFRALFLSLSDFIFHFSDSFFFLSPRLSACNLRRTKEEEGRFSDFRFELSLSLSLFLISFFIFLINFPEFSFFVFRKMISFFLFPIFLFF